MIHLADLRHSLEAVAAEQFQAAAAAAGAALVLAA